MSKCGNCCYGVMTGPNRMFCSAQNCFCEEVFYCEDYEPIVKHITNYDRLISKTPEELAMWMWLRGCPTEEINESCMNNKTKEKSCTRCWLDWLKAPAEYVPHEE